jgi:hypothetical protein
MAFEEKKNEFIFSLRSSTNVQDSLILNSRNAGMLNNLTDSNYKDYKYPVNHVNSVKSSRF